MHTITRTLVLMSLVLGGAPHSALTQNAAPLASPNASAPGSVSALPAAPVNTSALAPSAISTVPAEAAPTPAKPARRRLKLGVNYSLFMPTDGRTRDRFSGSWSSVGLGIGGVEQRGAHSVWSPEFNVLYQSKSNNRVLMAPLGVSYRAYRDTSGSAKPYVGASAGALIVNLQSQQDNISSGTSTGAYGSVFVGASLTDDFFVEARYYAANKVRSFDLSGVSLSTGVRF